MAKETAVSDTGPLLHLSQINKENLLNIFQSIIVSEEVRNELIRHGNYDRIKALLIDQFTIAQVTRIEIDEQRNKMRGFKVHKTDLSVAALAAGLSPDVVLTDDLELRKGLEVQDHTVVGSVGILIHAFQSGKLDKSELFSSINKLFDNSTLYLSKGFAGYVRKLIDNI